MKSGVMLLAGGICCLSLIACQKPSKPPQPAEAGARVDQNKGHPPKDDCTGADTQIPAVLVKVSSVEQLQAIQYAGKTDKDGNIVENGSLKQITPPYPFPNNQLSVDAQPYLKKKGEIMLLELELEQPGYTFSPPNTVITEDSAPSNGEMFCVKKTPPPIQPKANQAIFYVHYLDGAPKGVIGHYTFDYLPANGHTAVRVKVDPDVSNDG